MNAAVYTRYELLRTLRNRRFFFFSLGFPLVLYFVIAGPNRHELDFQSTGISAPLYYMTALASWGTMMAILSTGGRIATERQYGWNRQLRISPLSTRVYFRIKVVTGYALALISLVALYVSGLVLGVHLSAGHWLEMTVLILAGLIPFAALGVLMGHLLTADSVGPAMGGITSLLALVSGVWFPISSGSILHDVAQFLPSYWLVQAGRVGVGGQVWGATAWLVVAVWTVVLAALARRAYRRDTERAS